jgi:uncharacterized protein YecE (DUF72 family)
MTIRIGTSGWAYAHWRGIVYPRDLPQRDWFAFYAREFDTVEINNSFYRLPTPDAFAAWGRQAPADFLYAVKASRYLTHMKKLASPEEPLQRFFEGASRLGSTLGPVLYQLPPSWRVNLSRLEQFLSVLPGQRTHVLEFRDQSWLIEDVFRLLERYGVAHCIHDLPPLNVPVRVTAPLVYLRLHGGSDHGGHYERGALAPWARRIADWHHEKLDVVVYFNNDVGGSAVKDARMLKQMLER